MAMFRNIRTWLLLVLTVANQTRATKIVYPRLLEGRAEVDLKLVKISDDITLSLKKSSIFSEEFFIHSKQDGAPIAYHMSGPEMEKNLYHDEEHMASVHLSEQNGISIEGVVGDKLRIKPMDGMERSLDGQIPHRLYDINYADNEDPHRDDYAVPNTTATNITLQSRLLWNTGLRMPVLIHPEVHVVADYDISRALKFDEKKIARYVAILGNSANLRFRSMVQPRVQLVIVGITVTNKPSDEPYMVKVEGYEATKNILYSDTIAAFNNYVMKQSYFAQSDIIFLITGKNMSRWDDRKLYSNTGGFAYCGGACTKWKVGMIEERVGSYYGVFVFAHEIAHSLGCVHDGERANPWPAGHIGSEDCPYDAGYMMTYKFTAPNMYKFSPCCQREVLNIYNRPPYHCLSEKNSVEARVYSSKLPGEVSSRTTYCKLVYKSYSYVEADKKYDMSKCIVKCFIDKKGGNMLIGAVDGVHCGKKKVCVLGNCTHKPTIKKAE